MRCLYISQKENEPSNHPIFNIFFKFDEVLIFISRKCLNIVSLKHDPYQEIKSVIVKEEKII